jgi:hypothetical protein
MLMDAGDCANAPVKARATKPTTQQTKRSDIFIIIDPFEILLPRKNCLGQAKMQRIVAQRFTGFMQMIAFLAGCEGT